MSPSQTQGRAPSAPRELPHIEIFYDIRDCSYLFPFNGRYLPMKKTEIKELHLRRLGFTDAPHKEGLREIDRPFLEAQQFRMIDYAGALGGHRVGCFKDSARSYLVTDEAKGVWDEPGTAETPQFLLRFIQELLPDDQSNYFLYWLKLSLESLRSGDFRPGQAIVLAGESSCGKSLLQSIITEVLGGRAAEPFRYMMNETQFNKDLSAAEHWRIEDPPATTDMRSRRHFGNKIKECTVNRDFSIHQKGKDALSLSLFRRLTISVNDEPENLAVVPPMDASMTDKIFLFKCAKADVGSDRKATWTAVIEELPAFRAHLLRMPAVPPELQDPRFGIKAWAHPDLLAILTSLSAESRLLQAIDQVLFSCADLDRLPETRDAEPRLMKAMELEEMLRASKFGFAVEGLLRYAGACGSHLGKLAKSQPNRVQGVKIKGQQHWKIFPPPKAQLTDSEETV